MILCLILPLEPNSASCQEIVNEVKYTKKIASYSIESDIRRHCKNKKFLQQHNPQDAIGIF